ncbi:MAG: 50S ribosomal protein L11 methyltransferase [Syntrophobacteraceae bacterium]
MTETMLKVYEIKGSGPPPDAPPQGLEGIWPEPPFYYLFYRKDPCGLLSQWLGSHTGWSLTGHYELPYEKWQDIPAREISLGLFDILIAKDLPGRPGRIKILMDPGVVFGSGLHPTTQGCLLAISQIFRTDPVKTALDFGTGTGILAIACALAGARLVAAVDRNPMAVRNAAKNATVNGVSERVVLAQAQELGCLNLCPDFLVINVEWPILEKILATGQWRNAKRAVLAGFLPSKLEEVKKFALPGFEVRQVLEVQGWPTVILSKTLAL